MTEQSKGVSGGQTSQKPTEDELERKRQEILERVRKGALNINLSENPVGPKQTEITEPPNKRKRYKNKKFTCPEEITNRNHTYRLRRMEEMFGKEQVQNLEKSCDGLKEFKWELFQAEEKGVIEVTFKDSPYEVDETTHQGAAPIEVKWMGNTYYIDRQTTFKVEYCDKLIEYMKFGRSPRSFAAHINVTSSTFNGWVKRYKILQDAIDIAYGKGLEVIETLCFFVAAGMDANQMSQKFGVNRINYKMLQFIAKSKFREDFFEKVQVDSGDMKKLADLEGPELEKAVADIKQRYNKLMEPSPIKDFNLYKG